ncbi:MAG: hypothetical protein FIB05_03415 [Betaproteobacteria bacterium]|nr:hypothetical protein [Betaproteobacteria bacterium]
MPRKKSVKHSAVWFQDAVDSVVSFATTASRGQADEHVSWIYCFAVIRLYRDFEALVLDALVGAVNNDTTTIAATTGIDFPAHLTDEVCEFLITGTGYFDFKGRSGLIKTIKAFVPEGHYLLTAVKQDKYREALDALCALRNFAAHESDKSKRAVLDALQIERISSSGAWLKRQERLKWLANRLKSLAADFHAGAPY